MNDVMYVELKKDNMFHVIREICHSKVLNHYTRYSITMFEKENKAWEHMKYLESCTDIKIKHLF